MHIDLLKLHKNKACVVLFFSVIGLIATFPIFRDFEHWGIQDWDQHLFYHAVPRVTLLEYHQFPLWNPYYCGGTVLLANPQSRFLSPTFLLILLFDVVKGIKIEIWLHLVIGLVGVYCLGRHYKLDQPSAVLSSFVFMLSSMYALNLTVGHTCFLSVAYVPWAFLYYLKAFRDLRYALVSGLFFVLMFFEGGAWLLSITVLFLALYSLILVCSGEHQSIKAGSVLCIIAVYTLCLGAIKFLPAIEFLLEHPRPIDQGSGFSLNSLQYGLFGRDQTLAALRKFSHGGGFVNGMSYHMDENGMYVGILPALLFLIGMGYHGRSRIALALCFVIFLWVAFGDRIPIGLWTLLYRLPLYNSMRVAQRFRVAFMLCFSIFVGFGFQTVKDHIRCLSVNRVIVLLFTHTSLMVILVDLLVVNTPVLKDAFPIPPLSVSKSANFFQIWNSPSYDKNGIVTRKSKKIYSSWGALYPTFLANIGTVAGYEPLDVPRKAIPIESYQYKGEVYLHRAQGAVHFVRWSPNRIVISVDALSEGYVILNQNYYPGWRVIGDGNHHTESVDGLLAVRISSYDKAIELYYLPTSFVIGSIVSLATVLGSIVFLSQVRTGLW